MELKIAKCTSCGANLQVDSEVKTAICEFCGATYIVEEAIGLANAEKNRLLNNAKTFEKFEDYDKAEEIYTKITSEYPDEYRGWLGLAELLTNFFENPDLSSEEYELLSSHMKRTLICATPEQKESINSQWNAYKEKYNSFINQQKLNIESLEKKKKELDVAYASSWGKAKEYEKNADGASKIAKILHSSSEGEGGLILWGFILMIIGAFGKESLIYWGLALCVIGILVFVCKKVGAFIEDSIFKKNRKLEEGEKVEYSRLEQESNYLSRQISDIKEKYGI